ncbi:hypothetical protein ACFXA4_16565 [Streptomyces sp. NPDC059442]|uniref:hypothetical protein n=1 Tax=Streptomyces sp. NPDC059442 TaxID=3346830 RepID=UPI0036D1B211
MDDRIEPNAEGSGVEESGSAAALRAEADRAERPDVSPWAPREEARGGQEKPEAPVPSPRRAAASRREGSFLVKAKDFHFPALANGLDFLRSAVELLARQGGPEPRDLKYAVLHLHAAAEVLFKARLEMHQPALVWANTAKFDEAKHKAGKYRSCGAEKAIERLNESVDLAAETILDPEDEDLVALGQLRNRLTHFGGSDTFGAVQARTLPVLTLLMNFLRFDVLPHVEDPDEAWTAEQEMDEIRGDLQHITAFVAQRMSEIANQLSGHEDVTVPCRTCGKYAVLLDGGAVTCHFCWQSYGSGVEAAWEYIGESRHVTIKDGGQDFDSCSVCGDSAVAPVNTAAAPDTISYVCFSCGNGHAGVCDYCQQAGDLAFTVADMGEDMCEDCYAYRLAKF